MRRSLALAGVLLVAALGLPAASPGAQVTPTQGQVLENGTAVGGECLLDEGRTDGRRARWEVANVIPAFLHGGASGGVQLAPPAEQLPRFGKSPLDVFGDQYVLVPKLMATPARGAGCGVRSFDPLQAVTLEEAGPHVFVQYNETVHFVAVPSGVDGPTAQPCAQNDPDFPSPGDVAAPPPPPGDASWAVDAFCNTTKVVGFYVKAASSCPASGDMSRWPGSQYINQYDAGARLGLPVRWGRKGGNACGPSSLLMAMLTSAGSRNLDGLRAVFDGTMQHTVATVRPEGQNSFDTPGKAVRYAKSMGWRAARYRPLGQVVDGIEQQILTSLKAGPVVISTAFGNSKWGVSGGGHMIAIVGADGRGGFIVNDPAGNYFTSPNGGYFGAGGHYGPGSCGYRAIYPHLWVLAFTTSRGLLELGARTPPPRPRAPAPRPRASRGASSAAKPRVSAAAAGGPRFGSAISISDAHPGGADAPRTFYLQDGSGRRAGWIDGAAVEEIPEASVGQAPPGWTEPAVGDTTIAPAPPTPPVNPRSVVVPGPALGVSLHVAAPAGQRFALRAEASEDGALAGGDSLTGTGTGGAVVVPSRALAALQANARLSAAKARVRGRAVSVALSCTASAKSTCRFAIELLGKQGRRAVTFARRAGTLPSGKTITVRLRPGARVLARHRRLAASLVVRQVRQGAPAVVVRRQQLGI